MPLCVAILVFDGQCRSGAMVNAKGDAGKVRQDTALFTETVERAVLSKLHHKDDIGTKAAKPHG